MIKKAICLSVVLLVTSASAGTYSGGDGSAENPYKIATPNDFNDIGNHPEDWDAHFVMVNDVNLAEYTGTQFNIIGNSTTKFTGVFDGNNHTISNFSYESDDTDYVGLFGYVDDPNAVIRDLHLTDPNVHGDNQVGALAGCLKNGTVANCHCLRGSASGTYFTGGLVGYNSGTISNCYAMGGILGEKGYTGGLVGYNSGTICDCYAAGLVSGEGNCTGGLVAFNVGTISNCYATAGIDGNYIAGGLVGDNDSDGTISNCYASGNVDADDAVTGGLVGYNGGAISDCFATGSVEGIEHTGGLVGKHFSGTISDCYATGSVMGQSNTGGLLGKIRAGTISNCYAAGSVTGQNYTGGLIGYAYDIDTSYASCFWDCDVNPTLDGIGNTSDPNVIGKPTAQMQTERTFTDAGWDFVEIWNIGENQTYPFLRVYPAGDLNHDGRVDFFDFAIVADHWLEGTKP